MSNRFQRGDRVRVKFAPNDPFPIGDEYGYVCRRDEDFQGIPCYQVYLSRLGSYPVYRQDMLHPAPRMDPILHCKLADGSVHPIEYRTQSQIYLVDGDGPKCGTSMLSKARFEAWQLARYHSGYDDDEMDWVYDEREYWVGYQTGTCMMWECFTNRPGSPNGEPSLPSPPRGGGEAAQP